jgi:RNA polymerase sigma-70 factor (ECF subfamily)
MALLVSRFDSRLDENNEIIVLEDQDRSKWNQELIGIGMACLAKSSRGEKLSRYHIEAAIVAEHSIAVTFDQTNWEMILSLYDQLVYMNPSPVVYLNRAIVIGRLKGTESAIAEILMIDNIDLLLQSHHLFSAVLGELYIQTGNKQQAGHWLMKAISLTHSVAEKKLLQRKMDSLNE